MMSFVDLQKRRKSPPQVDSTKKGEGGEAAQLLSFERIVTSYSSGEKKRENPITYL